MRVFCHNLYIFLIKALRKHKIHTRLLLSFLLISLVPVITIGIFSYRTYTQSIHSKVKAGCLQSIELLNNNMTTQLGVFSNYLAAISVNDAIQEGIRKMNMSTTLNHDVVKNIGEAIGKIPFQSIYLKNLRIVNIKHDIVYDLGYDDISKQQFEDLIKQLDASSPKDTLQYIQTYRSNDKIALGRKIYDLHHPDIALGYILLYIDETMISNSIFTDISFGNNFNFLLLDHTGNIVSAQKKSTLGTSVGENPFFKEILTAQQQNKNYLAATIDSKQYYVVFTYSDTYNVYLVALIPQSYITQDTNILNTLLISIVILFVVISLAITFLVYGSVMQPINSMIYACNTTDDAEIGLSINDKSPDELGFLARTIDNMVHELGILIQRSIRDEKHMRELELETLHYQINPHFLFNTLNTLKWIAKLNNITPVSHGIEALSSLLQSTLITRNEMIKLSDELCNLKNYCAIQQLRYAGSFEVNYEISNDTYEWQVPRFILQPLVENSILHGQNSKDDLLSISIHAYIQSDLLIIEINDNGKGFELDKVKNAQTNQFAGVGLSNVDERMKLHYGPKFGLTIQSTLGVGTKCILRIPQNIIR